MYVSRAVRPSIGISKPPWHFFFCWQLLGYVPGGAPFSQLNKGVKDAMAISTKKPPWHFAQIFFPTQPKSTCNDQEYLNCQKKQAPTKNTTQTHQHKQDGKDFFWCQLLGYVSRAVRPSVSYNDAKRTIPIREKQATKTFTIIGQNNETN